MTDSRTSDRDVDRAIRSWLHEDRHEDASRIAGAVLDRVEATPRRRATWWPARRMPIMSKFVTIGLGAAAAVVALFVGAQLLGPPTGSVGDGPSQSVEPSSPGDGSLPVGPHVMVSSVGLTEERVTVTIPALGWFVGPGEGSVTKDDRDGYPLTVMTVPGDHFRVPESICNWQTATDLVPPNEPVGGLRAHELLLFLSQQTDDPDGLVPRDFAEPVDITIDGQEGNSVTGVLPSDPLACDEERFCSLLDEDGAQCLLLHERNQLVRLWISDSPDRNLWVVAATYWPTTDPELLAEMDAIVDSMD